MDGRKIILEVEIDEAQTIINALSNMPFGQVSALVPKIMQQANGQIDKPSVAGTDVKQ